MFSASDVYMLSENSVLTYSVDFGHWNDPLDGGSVTVWVCCYYTRISPLLELTGTSALNCLSRSVVCFIVLH
jgi:hypothetical protein